MMKRLALTIALAGLSGGAFAADLRGPIIEAPPPLPVPVAGFSWTGGYAGVNVGIGAGHTDYAYDVNTYNNGNNNNNNYTNNAKLVIIARTKKANSALLKLTIRKP